MTIIRSSSFLLFMCYISKTQGCSTTKLPKGVVLGCIIPETNIPFDVTKNVTVPTGATCYVETEEAVIRVTCNGTHLIQYKDIEEHKGHIRRKRGWFRRVVRGIGHFVQEAASAVVCVATLFSCLWGGRAGPVDRTPPGMTCEPPFILVTAKPYEIYAYATWNEPTAHDETDGKITPRRKSGRPPGSHFPEFDTRVTYEAKDKSGNRAECTIIVRVKIVRCDPPKPVDNGYFQCNPVTEFINGGRCRFGCYEGFDLSGGQEIIYCQENGQWSAPQPICEPWKCDGLHSLDGAGNPVCTNGFYFRSICVYSCLSGFDMPPKVSKAVVCDKTKSWRKFGEPKCIDVEAPTFSECPSIVVTGTDTGSNSTEVSWKQPKATDNSNTSEVFLKQGEYPGSRLTAGTYTIQYGAKDTEGNEAIHDCNFKVIVREIRCAKLYPTPFAHIDCPSGYRSGSQCNISCDPGKILVGSDNVECERHPVGLFGVWNWKDAQQSFCKNGRTCVSLNPPKNGAVACDNWEGGHFCQIQCRNGTQMSGVSLKKLYVCSKDGEWSSSPPSIRTCREVRRQNVQHTLGLAAFYYYNGDCTDPTTQLQIASNFISALNGSLFQPEVCPDSTECNPRNVQITCGESDRKRRSTDDYDTQIRVLGITMSIPVAKPASDTVFSDSQYLELIASIKDTLKEKEHLIFGNTSVSEKLFKSNGLKVQCPEGAIESEQSLGCVDCPEGTFYTSSSTSTECVACHKGFYQENIGQTRCKRCPEGTTTQSVGADSEAECHDACPPGSFSQDGLFPCSPCEQGEYQPSFGQMSCKKCRGSKSTLSFGSKSSSKCEEFDIEFVLEERSDLKVLFPANVTVGEFSLDFWFQRLSTNVSLLDSSLTVTLSDIVENEVWTWNNLSSVIRSDSMVTGTDLKLSDQQWHYIMLYSGPACEIVVTLDGAPIPLKSSNGICNDIVFNTLTISTEKAIGGSFSQFNMWYGKSESDYRRRCFSEQVGDMLFWNMFSEAYMSGAYIQIPSQCDDFNNCVSSPCLHGSCTDALHHFTCKCDNGYVGTQCDVNVDDCQVNICMNNATCLDGVATYTCQCLADYTGQYCQIEMVDGGWSEWGNWSECSTTCGDGKRTRKRLCNSPNPDNGGIYCVGEHFDLKDCNNLECPVCQPIVAPLNGSLDCSNDTDNINCTVSCDEGFEFDTEPLPLYYCGPETFQEWNFQTDENPERRLPKCVEIKLPQTLKVYYSAYYRYLYCATEVIEHHAREEIELVVKSVLPSIPCLQKQTCNLTSFEVINCDSVVRRRRAAVTAGFRLQISNKPAEEDKNETDLEEAFQYIQDAADNGVFTVEILDDEFELDGNLTDISGEVLCGPGETRVRFYCVPCGKGSYLFTDYCKPCPIGTYQDTEGQSTCISCPSGKSTVGIRSAAIDDCTVVEIETFEEGLKVIGIIVGSACALVVVLIVVLVYRRFKSKKNLTATREYNLTLSSKGKNPGKLGPSNLKFEPQTLGKEPSSEVNLDGEIQESETSFETSKEDE